MTGPGPERQPDWWLVLAIVLLGVGMLVGFTFAGLNRLAINDQQHRFQAQTTADIAAAKAAAIAAADAETLRKVCGLVAAIPDPPISTRYAEALGCPPTVATGRGPATSSSTPSSGAAAGSNRLDQPGRTSTTAAPAPSSRPGLTSPQPRPSSSSPPRPSMSPPPTPLLCLIQPVVQIGACP